MMYFAQSSPASNPTTISQYGPLIAALIVLAGAMITLFVNARNDQRRYRSQREDEYRRDQRTAIAAVAVAGHNFRRECGALEVSDNWDDQRSSADAAMATLLNELTVARLLVQDSTLQEGLDGVFGAWDAVAGAVDRLEDSLINQPLVRQKVVESLQEALHNYDTAANELYTAALGRLKPTVVETRLWAIELF
jgi:hypothetical protein